MKVIANGNRTFCQSRIEDQVIHVPVTRDQVVRRCLIQVVAYALHLHEVMETVLSLLVPAITAILTKHPLSRPQMIEK